MEQYFIQINNELVIDSSNLHLNEKELYIYSLLLRDVNYRNESKTTLNLIGEFSNGLLGNRPDNTVNNVRSVLMTLKEKGLIDNLTDRQGEIVNIADMKAHDGIILDVIKPITEGHIQVSIEYFDQISSLTSYYIYVAVAKWDKVGGFKSSYDRWARVLGKSRSYTIKSINKAVKDKIIYKNIGDYKEGTQEQEVNVYKLSPIPSDVKTKMTVRDEDIKKTSLKKSEREFKITKEFTLTGVDEGDEDLKSSIESFLTYEDSDGVMYFPSEHDFIYYIQIDMKSKEELTDGENYFKSIAEKRMIQMKENQAFQNNWNAAMYFISTLDDIEAYDDSDKEFVLLESEVDEPYFVPKSKNVKIEDESIWYTNPSKYTI